MMIRSFFILGATAMLTACQPAVPDSGAGIVDPGRGVGFDNPSTLAARQARDTQLAGSGASPQISSARAVSDPQGLDAELAGQANAGQGVINASPSNTAPPILNNPGISDENSFDAVASRESIQSDAARIATNRQQYEVIQPTALPTRDGAAQPNVVQYALQSDHPKGTKVYRRAGLGSAAKFQRNCARYVSADEAQIDFLSNGGPERDREGLDPDGDGYACAWDPASFRRASGG